MTSSNEVKRIVNSSDILRVAETPQTGYIYLINAVSTNKFKIGKSRCSVLQRIEQLQTGCPLKLRYVYHACTEDMNRCERELHLLFKRCRSIGEWFDLTSDEVKECITLMRLVQIDESCLLSQKQEQELANQELKKELENLSLSIISSELPEDEVSGLTKFNLERGSAIELISKLKDERHNQTEIIWMLWNARPGKTKAYELALAEYKELTTQEGNNNG